MTRLRRYIRSHEGKSYRVYEDTLGVPTIGIGHNLRKDLPDAVVELLFDYDLNDAITDAWKGFPWFRTLDTVRREVIVAMIFQLGLKGVASFKRMIAAIERGDWEEAAREGLDSRWARQTPGRARETMEILRTGQYPEGETDA